MDSTSLCKFMVSKDTIKRSWCVISLFPSFIASSLSDENATKSNMDFVQEPSAAAAQSKSSLSSFALHGALEWYMHTIRGESRI